MSNKILEMSHAVKLAGPQPVWAAKICKNIGGRYEWLNSEGWSPLIRAEGQAGRFDYKYNYDNYVPASFGNTKPSFFDVEGVNNKNSILVDSEIHFELANQKKEESQSDWNLIEDRDATPGCGRFPTIEKESGGVVLNGEWYSSFEGDGDDLRLISAAPEMLKFILNLQLDSVMDEMERNALLNKISGRT